MGPIHVVAIRIFAGVTAIALILGSHLFIQRTRLGKAMRATFQDGEMARLVGVDVDRVYAATFSFGAALAGASGVLLGSVFWVYPAMGDQAAMKSFAVVIMGGLGDFLGAIVGGLLLGVAESLGAAYISSGYKDAIGFVVIIVLLLFRPQGLFGRRPALR
jgi:branched-chain amino acid transport system permease protein